MDEATLGEYYIKRVIIQEIDGERLEFQPLFVSAAFTGAAAEEIEIDPLDIQQIYHQAFLHLHRNLSNTNFNRKKLRRRWLGSAVAVAAAAGMRCCGTS